MESPFVDISCFGVLVRITLAEGWEELAGEIRQAWEWADAGDARSSEPEVTIHVATRSDDVSGKMHTLVADDPREMLDRLTGMATRLAIERRKNELLMLHAGAVADFTGERAVAFMGPSGRGKTTATAALGRMFTYLSDETVALTDFRRVMPYQKPLSVKEPGETWKRQEAPNRLGICGPSITSPLLVGLLILRRDEKQNEPVLIPVRAADVIEELVQQISYLTERDRPLRRVMKLIDEVGGLHEVSYGEAETLIPIVDDLLEKPLPKQESWAPAPIVGGEKGVVRFGDVTDAVYEDDRVIVLNGRTVRVLDGISRVVWQTVATHTTWSDIVKATVEEYGKPPEGQADDKVRVVIDELVAHGLLAWNGAP